MASTPLTEASTALKDRAPKGGAKGVGEPGSVVGDPEGGGNNSEVAGLPKEASTAVKGMLEAPTAVASTALREASTAIKEAFEARDPERKALTTGFEG